MQNNEIASCWLKIQRAKEHFATLQSEISAWMKTEFLRVVKEADAEGRVHRVFVEVINQPPSDRWSLIAGDCVHNLRSALDSLVYGIAIYQTGQNPPKDERVLQFPIVSSPAAFLKQRYRISSLSTSVQSEIEKTQPYNRPHPEFPPVLELLNILSNQDKHRMLNVVAAAPNRASIEMVHSPDSRLLSVTAIQTIIVDKTEILSFTVDPPNPHLDYKCEMIIPVCILHPRGPSKSPFSELFNVLNSIIIEVETIANQLAQVV
jgi:hypothetical protein